MAKDPAFLFYPNDWIGGTMGMTFEEKGAYMELLMMQFNRGHMTKDMIGQSIGQLWVNIQDKFEVDSEGRYFNRRLDDEKEKRKNFVRSRANNRSGKNQHTKQPKKPGGHMTSHMENVNVNEDVIVIKGDRGMGKGKPSLGEFLEYALQNKPKASVDALELKYKAWVANGWKTGGAKPREIKNWKSTILNTLPHIPEAEESGLTVMDKLRKKYGITSS